MAFNRKRKRMRELMGGAALFLVLGCSPAHSATYYVDFQSGSDTASGLRPTTAWKHAPGDPLATSAPASVKLQPGDTVRFRGGVRYRGAIRLPSSGTKEAPIVFTGEGWGDQPAIFDGGNPVTSVTPCSSAQVCGNAKNWSQLSLIIFEPPRTRLIKFFDSKGALFESQYPAPKDPFFSDNIEEYEPTPIGQAQQIQQGSLESKALAAALAGGASGAEISIWIQGNKVVRLPIQEVSGAVLKFPTRGLKPYTDRPGRAAIANVVGSIDKPGLYAVIAPGRAVAWLRDSGKDMVVGDGRKAVDIQGCSNVVLRGFVFEHFVSGSYGEGVQIHNSGGVSNGLIITNNVFRHSSLFTGDGAIMLGKMDSARIAHNAFMNLERGSGIRTAVRPLSNIEISDNRFERLGQTGILIMGSTDIDIANNYMTGLHGIHGNGISLYLDNRGVTVRNNRIIASSRPMTFHGERPGTVKNLESHAFTISGNTFATDVPSAAAIISFGDTRDVIIEHNVLVGPANGLLLSAKDSGVIVRNNETSGISIKGSKPSSWIIDDNRKLSLKDFARRSSAQ